VKVTKITDPDVLAIARRYQDDLRRHEDPTAAMIVAESDAMSELGIRLCVDANGAWSLTRRSTAEERLWNGAPETIILRERPMRRHARVRS
jgi:hypothetical protein